jgi:ATP phosphoribosyltransferase regulatory subunit
VPKGSLNADSIEALASAGLDVTGLDNPGRSLIISNPGVDYIIVRPSDAPVFVETGAADCGICGEDSLLETETDVVELVDLRFGACRFIVAEPEGAAERTAEHYRQLGSIRVATKYPRIARAHFARRGTQVEIVELHGNIELGPLTGMSECIVDITATGTTLRENNLVITDEVLSSTARFFANVASFRTDPRVRDLAAKLYDQSADRALKVTAGGEGK